MESLLCLPNEIILDIAEYSNAAEINALTQTCDRLHGLLNPLLYRHGLDLDSAPLIWAAERNMPDTARRVFQYTTPPPDMLPAAMSIACEKGGVVMARLLLEHGARTPWIEDDGSLLFKAATRRHFQIVQLLLKYGAAPDMGSNRRKAQLVAECTSVESSQTKYDLDILKLLIEHGIDVVEDPNVAWLALGLGCKIPVLTHLLDLGLNPNGSTGGMFPSSLLTRVINHSREADDAVCAEFVKRSIELGADVNVVDRYGVSLLHLAAGTGLLETMRLLVAGGAEVDVEDQDRKTPLVYAFGRTWCGLRADVIDELLGAGADIAAIYNSADETFLSQFFRSGNQQCIRLLLTSGLEQISRMRGSDLILAAAMLGDDSAAHRVLNECEGVDLLESKDWDRNNALMLAARFGRHDVLQRFLVTVDAMDTSRNIDGDSALHLAMYSGSDLTVKLLMQRQKDVNFRNKSHCTPLALATQYSSCAVVEALLDSGSDITIVDYRRESLLHFAVDRGDATIIKALLERDAPRNLKNSRGHTPLSLAIWNDREDLVRLLLDHRVSVDDRDGLGYTPLMVAVLKHSLGIVRLLVARGAQLDITCDRGLRAGTAAFRMALEGERPDVAQLLLESGADPNGRTKQGRTLLMRAIQQKWQSLACSILRKHGSNLDLDVAAEDDRAQTALTWAAQSGFPDVVRELLRHGANAHHCDADGGTLITWAAYGGNVDVLRTVVDYLDKNSRLEVQDQHGNTPLLIAASRGHMGAVEWLVAHGVNLDHGNYFGQTAASLAAQEDHIDLLLWLVRRGVGGITDAEWRTCMYANSYDLCGRVIYPPLCIRDTGSAWG
ncbi:ankyrin repeat-containing domain protein [Aspergillus insuetus]